MILVKVGFWAPVCTPVSLAIGTVVAREIGDSISRTFAEVVCSAVLRVNELCCVRRTWWVDIVTFGNVVPAIEVEVGVRVRDILALQLNVLLHDIASFRGRRRREDRNINSPPELGNLICCYFLHGHRANLLSWA